MNGKQIWTELKPVIISAALQGVTLILKHLIDVASAELNKTGSLSAKPTSTTRHEYGHAIVGPSNPCVNNCSAKKES